MAGNIPMGSMSTEIKLNGSQSVKTLRELKQAVTQATSAWKAQRAELSTIGKSTEAAEAQYKGLAETIKKQKDYISGLQEAQKHLTEAQKSVDKSTREGRQEYGKYNEALQKNETRIHSAEQKLVSLTNQQTKAKSSLNYYKSGLAEAQKSLKQTQDVTRSYVERLKAEGKEYEATKIQLTGYKNSLENLNKQQKIQQQELARIASESGKSSDAYKRQQIRVNETATSIAKMNTNVKATQSEMNKLNPSPFQKLKDKLTGVNSEATKTHRTFKEVFMGSALGTGLTNVISNISGQFKTIYKDGMEFNAVQGKINARFKSMGLSARSINSLDKQIKDLKYNTSMTGEQIADLQTKMTNWSVIGNRGARQMTRMIAGVGDSSKLTGDQISQMGASLMRVGSTGKVTYSALNRITKGAPTFYAQLAKGAGMSEDKLKAMLRTGKVTQKQFQQWMAAAGKYSDEAFKGYGKTQGAAIKRMQDSWMSLKGTMMKPLFDAKTNGLQTLSKLLTSKELQAGAKAIGNGINSIVNAAYKHRKDITGIAKDVVSIAVQLGKSLWKDFAGIITDIGKSFGLIHGNSKKSGSSLHTVKLAMDGLAKNKTAIQWISKAIIAMGAAKGISKVGGGLLSIASSSVKAYKNIKAFRAGLKGIDTVKEFKGAEGAFNKLGSTASTVLSKIKSIAGNALSGKSLGGALQSMRSAGGFKDLTTAGKVATGAAGVGVAIDAATSIVKGIKDKVGSRKQYEDIGTGAGSAIGGAIGIWFGGPAGAAIGSQVGKVVGKWGGDAVKSFQNGWNKKKPPKKFWSLENLGWSTHDMFNKIGKWGSDVGKTFKNGFNTAKKSVTNFNKSVVKNVGDFNKSVGKKYRQITSGIGKTFKKGWDIAYKHASKGTKQIMRSTEKFAKNYVKINKKANSETVKNFSSFGKRLKKNHGDLFKTIGQTAKKQLAIEKKRWSSNWKNIKTTAQGIWKGLNRNASDMYKKLNFATHGGLGKVLNGFKSFGKGIKDFWNGLWKGITKTFDDTVKNLQDAANNVGKFFTGKLKVGSLHLAGGTDWRKKYGVPAIVNDAPGNNYREGLITNGKVIPFPAKRNLPIWLMPGQDIINGDDMAKHFAHYANGTVDVKNFKDNGLRKLIVQANKLKSTQIKILKDDIEKRNKRYQDHKEHRDKLDRRRERKDSASKAERARAAARAKKDQEQLKKLGDRISKALKNKNGNEARRLTAEFNNLSKKYSADKKAAKKPDPHAGKVLVDQGLLIGAKSRIGHSVYISKDLFKKLIANLNKKKSTTRRRTTTHKRRSTTARRTSTRRYSSKVTTPRISSGVSARISTVGLGSINGLSKALKGIKSKSIKVVAKASGTKAVASLAKSVGKVKGGSHKVTVKTSGLKSLKSLYKATRKIKGKTHKVRVKASGTKGLKSLQKNITSVHKRIDSLSKASKKDKFGKAIAKQAEEAVKSLKSKGNFAKQFESMTKKFNKDLKNMTKNSKKEFKSMWSDIEHQSKTGQSRLTHEMSSFSSHYKKSWSSLENGVHRTFGQFWSKMKSAAGRGVNNVIRILNSAIGKIDNVISDFGGSKSAVHKASPVHYAGGTDANGRLMHDTLAIVNDAKSGPRQEAIVTDQNDVILPKGNDVPVMLRKGWGVLNGTQTQQLGLPHFANGTGLKGLYELAKKYWNHPVKTGESMFGAISGLSSAMKDLALGMRNTTEKSGVNWWSQLWKMVADKVNDDAVGKGGTREAFLKYAEKVFSGVHYQMGAASKTLSDCSGMVMQALRHFGINIGRTTVAMQESNGVQYLGKNIRKTVPGDLVIFGHGTGAAGHVGIVKNPKAGTMFNETQPYARVSRIADDVSMGYGFYRVKGLHNASDSNNPKVKANNSLQSLIKKQVGQGFWRTIQKIADKYGENSFFGGMAGKPVGDVTHWMRQAHIPKKDWAGINYIVTAESGWNPRIVNPSSGTYGLGQMQGYNLHYYTRHGSKSNPIAQLMGIMDYIHDRYGSVANAVRFRKAHNWYANGGIANKPSIFGEAGPEMAIPLIPSKSTRAWELIGKAIGILSSQTNLQVQNANNEKERKEEHDFRQAVLLLLTEIAGKSDVAKITLTTPAGRALWSVIQPFAKQENKREITRLRRGLSGR